VASRSENLSVLLFFAAYAVFLCRPSEAIAWPRVLFVFLLAGAALGVKEHTFVLPALLLLTDYYWNPGFSFRGIRRNWRLYAPMAVLAVAGGFYIYTIMARANTAGFALKGLAWYEYFFTQWRALFVYLRLFVLPVRQTIDYDFPFSRTVFHHGAVFGLLALIAISAAAWFWRKRYPLASFGWFAFLLLIAPTSSVMPIKDPLAERRLYLSIFGLLLIVLEFARRLRLRPAALAAAGAAVLLVSGALAYQRNQVWADRIALWQDTVRNSPRNARAHFQLAYSYYEEGRCAEALPHYQRVLDIRGPDYDLMVDWALAHDCLGQTAEAVAKLRKAAAIDRTAHLYAVTGMVHAKAQQWQEALDALAEAERIDPNFSMIYVYRGGIRLAQNAAAAAEAEYLRALAIDPASEPARAGLAQARRALGKSR
jgi:tetratricopeptide (TPR) repeat protein